MKNPSIKKNVTSPWILSGLCPSRMTVAIGSIALLLAACGDDSGSNSIIEKPVFVPSINDLGDCTDELEGDTIFVKDEKADFVCVGGKWTKYDSPDNNDSSGSNDKPTSSTSSNPSSDNISNDSRGSSDSHGDATFSDVFYGPLTDPRDGQTYETVTIGKQTWMAKNLNYVTNNSRCYDDKASNCATYGRLYTWEAAMTACPEGWHLPTYDEWNTLFKTAGGLESAGIALRSTSGWPENENGTDAYAFSALPASGDRTSFWSASEIYVGYVDEYDAFYVGWNRYCMTDCWLSFGGLDHISKDRDYSVRCLWGPGSPTPVISGSEVTPGTTTDSRDRQTYKTVTIGKQTWMAENLNYSVDKSWCFDNEASNCAVYGRLYTWDVATTVCPKGWHLPTPGEWMTLFKAVGGQHVAGTALKATSGWRIKTSYDDGEDYNGNGTDTYGFSVLPAGRFDNPEFNNGTDGEYTYFWSDSEDLGCVSFYYDEEHVGFSEKEYAVSVRCIRDSN